MGFIIYYRIFWLIPDYFLNFIYFLGSLYFGNVGKDGKWEKIKS